MPSSLTPFEISDPAQHSLAAAIWTQACGPDLAITARLVEHNMRPVAGVAQDGRLARVGDQGIGFILVSALLDQAPLQNRDVAWVDAMAVLPDFQKQGVGGALLAWGETWQRDHSATSSRLGGSLRPFVAGLPTELTTEPFFTRRGYGSAPNNNRVWDVARDLEAYAPRPTSQASTAEARPARPDDENALRAFLQREFPGRWRYEFEEALSEGGRISDYMLLWSERGVDGFCQLTFEDSWRPLERFYLQRLPRPWGQLGSIGVSADRRAQGYGTILMNAGLSRLRAHGVRGCVIDWTSLLDYYAKFGFQPYRQYGVLVKKLTGEDE